MAYQGYSQIAQEGYSESQRVTRSPMLEAITMLDQAIEVLGKNCEIIEQRLQPILIESNPRPMPPSGAEIQERMASTPLTNEIHMRRERIQILTDRLVLLQERIGI